MLVGLVAAAGNGTLQPMQAVIMGHVFAGQAGRDAGVLERQIHENVHWMVVLAVVALVVNYVQFASFSIVSERVVARLKHACLASLLKQEVAFFDENPHSALAARVADQSFLVSRGIGDAMGSAVQFSSQFITGFAVSFSHNPRVASVMLLLLPLTFVLLTSLIFFVVNLVKRINATSEEATTVADEALAGITTVAAFNAEERAAGRYEAKLADLEGLGVKQALVRGLGVGFIFSAVFFTIGFGYFFGSRLVSRGGEDFGSVFTAVFSAVMGSLAISIATPNITAISQARVGAATLFRLVERPTKIDVALPGLTPAEGLRGRVEFRDVVFRYPTRIEALALGGVSFVVEPGTTCAIVGPSGSGKSTIIALLQRWYDPTSGAVLVDGVPVSDYQLAWFRSQCALVSQEPVLWDTSIGDNIRLGRPQATMEEVVEAARQADAAGFIEALPGGFVTRVGAGGSQLSGGQKQRIAIARALLRKPSLLLQDEPTSALDERAQRVVQEALDRVRTSHAGKCTSIVVAHRLSTIASADQIVVLEAPDGVSGSRVVEVGKHDELIRRGGTYARLFAAQAEASHASHAHATTVVDPVVVGTSAAAVSSAPSTPRARPSTSTAGDAAANSTSTAAMPSSSTHSTPQRPSDTELVRMHSASTMEEMMRGLGGVAMHASPRPTNAASVAPEDKDHNSSLEALLGVPRKPSAVTTTTTTTTETEKNVLVDLDDPNAPYEVPMSRVVDLSRPEAPWFVVGVLGSLVKGAAQPVLSVVVSHIIAHMILIPARIDGMSLWPCSTNADCGAAHPLCLHIGEFLPNTAPNAAVCARACAHASDCRTPGSTCINLKAVGVPEGLCIPPNAWRDGYAPSDVRATGKLALAMYSLVGLVAMLSTFAQQYSFGVIGERLTTRLRAMSFRAMLRQDASFFDDEKNKVGALLSRLSTDAAMVQTLTCEYTGLLFENLSTITTAVVIAFTASWRMAVVMVACAPLIIGSTWWQARMYQGRNRATNAALQPSAAVLSEALANVRTVQSFTAEGRIVRVFDEALEAPQTAAMKNAHVQGAGSGTSQALFFASYAIAFTWGAHLLSRGEIEPRSLNKAFLAITMASASIGQGFARVNDFAKSRAALSSIFRLVDRRPKIDATSGGAAAPAASASMGGQKLDVSKGVQIEFRSVTFRYPTRPDVTILRGLSLVVRPGQTCAVVGQSGSGKSSVVRLLLRMYDVEPDASSQVLVNGVDVRALDLRWWRSVVGLVAQEGILFRGSIRSNLLVGKLTATEAELMDALATANALEFVTRLPNGLDTEVGGKGSMMSGGQRQRLCIARAMLKDPAVLLLDEATSALDSESERVVQHSIDALLTTSMTAGRSRGGRIRTTLVIGHRLTAIRNADVIFVLANKDGRGACVVERGTHDELVAVEGSVYRAFYG